MSSYIETPFIIEQNRLQGIVNSCRDDLKKAINSLQEQREVMRQIGIDITAKENAKEVRAVSAMDSAKQAYNAELADEKEKSDNMKKELMQKLQNIRTQTKFANDTENILSKVSEIERKIRTTSSISVLNDMQEEINLCEEQMLHKIEHNTEDTYRITEYHTSYISGEKGVSLSNFEKTEKRTFREKLSDIFEQKIEMALANPHADRILSLKKMRREYNATADYEKDVYAKMHEKELEKILEKLSAMENSNRSSAEKKAISQKRYIALCGMLDITPDYQLLNDDNSTARLDTLNKEMFKRYNEHKKHEYLANALAVVLKRHDIEFQDSSAGEHESKFNFSMENAELSVSSTNNGILSMHVTGVYNGQHKTANDMRKSIASAVHLCSSMKSIRNELASEFGIYFQEIRTESPTEENITMKSANECSYSKKHLIEKNLKVQGAD